MLFRFLSITLTMALASFCSAFGSLIPDKSEEDEVPTITLNHSESDIIPAEGGIVVVNFETSHDWSIAIRVPAAETENDWYIVEGMSGTKGKGSTKVTFKENERETDRTLTVVIYSTNNTQQTSKTVDVIQKAKGSSNPEPDPEPEPDPDPEPEPSDIVLEIIENYGGPDYLYQVIKATNNGSETISAEIGLLCSSSSSMSNATSVSGGVLELKPGESNEAGVKISGLATKEYYYVKPYAKVNGKTSYGDSQSSRTDPLSFHINESNEYNYSEDGGSFDITLISNVPYEMKISTDWVTVTKEEHAYYNYYNEYSFSISANTAEKSRTATITFESKEYNASVTINIKQNRKIAASGEINGHTWVNLGLPSGTLWATTNVGADKPEEYGRYVSWGESVIIGEEDQENEWNYYNYETYVKKFYISYSYKFYYQEGKYTNLINKYSKNDGVSELEAKDDAASVKWGAEWTMPTGDQVFELVRNTHYEWTGNYNGVAGCIFYRIKSSGSYSTSDAHIFIPASGYAEWANIGLDSGDLIQIWSKSLENISSSSNPYHTVWSLYATSNNVDVKGTTRSGGLPVRPVVK